MYVLPVKHFIKDSSCSMVENTEDHKKENKKKEKEPELIVCFVKAIERKIRNYELNLVSPAKIKHPTLSNDAPPPDWC